MGELDLSWALPWWVVDLSLISSTKRNNQPLACKFNLPRSDTLFCIATPAGIWSAATEKAEIYDLRCSSWKGCVQVQFCWAVPGEFWVPTSSVAVCSLLCCSCKGRTQALFWDSDLILGGFDCLLAGCKQGPSYRIWDLSFNFVRPYLI